MMTHQISAETEHGPTLERDKRAQQRIDQLAEHRAAQVDPAHAEAVREAIETDARLFELVAIAEACYDVLDGRLDVVPTVQDLSTFGEHAVRIEARVTQRTNRLVQDHAIRQ